MKNNTKKLVEAALFAALVFVGTFIVKIPTIGTGGYIHAGDAFVILSGIFLGPVYGGFAAAIGSMLSDLIGGYFIYVPATFIIKGIVAFFAGLIFTRCTAIKNTYVRVGAAALSDIVFVILGYFLYEAVLYGVPTAAAEILGNFIQSGGGLIIALILYPILNIVHKQIQ